MQAGGICTTEEEVLVQNEHGNVQVTCPSDDDVSIISSADESAGQAKHPERRGSLMGSFLGNIWQDDVDGATTEKARMSGPGIQFEDDEMVVSFHAEIDSHSDDTARDVQGGFSSVVKSTKSKTTEGPTKKKVPDRIALEFAALPFYWRWWYRVYNACACEYFWVFWMLFAVFSALGCLERFYYNWFPDGQLPDPAFVQGRQWSFTFFHVQERITARLILVLIAAFLFTMTRVTHNWISEVTGLYDASNAIYRAHKFLGKYGFTSMVFFHVVGAFSPVLQRPMVITKETFWIFIVQQRRLVKFPVGGKWNMRIDDFFQGSIGLLVAFVVMPITIFNRKFRGKYYDVSFGLHIAGAFIMIWIVYRIPEHIRTFIFLSPFVLHYCIDRILLSFVYRQRVLENIKVHKLDKDYALLYFDPSDVPIECGDTYYIQTGTRRYEFHHPYTCFRQPVFCFPMDAHYHSVEKCAGEEPDMPLEEIQTIGSIQRVRSRYESTLSRYHESSSTLKVIMEKEKHNVLVGCLVRTFPIKRSRHPFSYYLVNQRYSREPLFVSGPYRKIYAYLTTEEQTTPYLIFCTGSGVTYALDYYMNLVASSVELKHPVRIVFSTHSRALYQWVAGTFLAYDVPGLTIECHLTRVTEDIEFDDGLTEDQRASMAIGRCDVRKIISECSRDTIVYFSGAAIVYKSVKHLCRDFGLRLRAEVPYI